jgi:hypothetical protein
LNDLFCNYWCRTIFPHLLRCPRRNLLFWSHSIDCPCTWTVITPAKIWWIIHEKCMNIVHEFPLKAHELFMNVHEH